MRGVARWPRSFASTASGRRAFGRGVWTLGSDAWGKAATLATTLIVARSLAPSEFGTYVAFVALGLVSGLAWDAGLSTLVLREVAAGLIDARSALLQGVRLRTYLLPAWILLTLAASVVVTGGRVEPDVLAPVLVASAAIAFHALAVGIGRGAGRFRDMGLTLMAGRIAGLGVTASVAAFGDVHTVPAFLWCAAIGEMVTLVLAIAMLVRERAVHTHAGRLSYRRAVPYAANTFLAYAYNRLDVLVVGALAGPAALAAYAPASRLQDAMLALPGAVTTVMVPEVAGRARSDAPAVLALTRRTAVVGFVAGTIISAALWVAAPTLVTVLLGAAYESSIGPTRVLIWFLPFAMVTAAVLALLIGTGRGSATTALFAVSFVVAMTMHVALDWWAGAMGAAVASLSRDPASAVAAWTRIGSAEPVEVERRSSPPTGGQ